MLYYSWYGTASTKLNSVFFWGVLRKLCWMLTVVWCELLEEAIVDFIIINAVSA